MSADNFNLVRKRHDGTWEVWLNLSASADESPQIAERVLPAMTCASKDAAVEWAEAQGYTEYGTKVEES